MWKKIKEFLSCIIDLPYPYSVNSGYYEQMLRASNVAAMQQHEAMRNSRLQAGNINVAWTKENPWIDVIKNLTKNYENQEFPEFPRI